MTAHLTLLGPFSAAIVYTTAKATITITVANANSFSIVSPGNRKRVILRARNSCCLLPLKDKGVINDDA